MDPLLPAPRISVIIPALDEEKLLPLLLRQLDEGIRARFGLEIILSDGGSTDATCAIAEDGGCRIVRHSEPSRQTIAAGRNAGAGAALGAILVFINADVALEDPVRFFEEVERVMASPRVAGATCAVHVFPAEQRLSDWLFHIVHNAYVRFLNVIGEGMGRGECQILRRSLFEELGGYNPLLAAGEDYDLFRRVRRRGPIVFLPGITMYESPRRFRRYGYLRIVWGWTRNAFSVVVRNRSASKEWETVR